MQKVFKFINFLFLFFAIIQFNSSSVFAQPISDVPAQEITPLLDNKAEVSQENVKFTKWENDKSSYFQIQSPIGTELTESVDGKLKQDDSDKEVIIYELPPAPQMEHGGIEYEIILKNKPSVNSISLQISKGNLVFYYQNAPSDDEKKHGDFMPDNVIGSYAVYHATKVGNEYKNGKAFHIYRPKAIDSNGKEVWCSYNEDLNETSVLIITCPQDFIDEAQYPVVIDPTFGDTDGGASSDCAFATTGTKATLSEAGDVSAVSISYSSVPTTSKWTGAIWNDSSGPASKAVQGDQQNFQSSISSCSSATYLTSNVSPTVNLSSGNYWIGGTKNDTTFDVCACKDDSTPVDSYELESQLTVPDPFGSGVLKSGRRYSVYVTYTASGGSPDSYSGRGVGRGIGRGILR